jgi:large repetitive protein
VGSDAFLGALIRASGENVNSYAINKGSLSAGSNYNISFVSASFTITPKPITVTANSSQTKVYGASDPALTYTASPILVGSDAFSGTLTKTSGENVNSYAINKGSLSAGSNYNISFVSASFTITPKPITVTANSNQTKVYGASDPALTYAASPTLLGSDAFSGTLTRTSGENANSYAINQGSLNAGSNYNINFVSDNFTIAPKPITVTANTNQTKIYGTTDPTFYFSATPNLLGSDAFTGQLSRSAGENVGSYAISKGTLSAGSNYSITYVPNNFSITPKPIAIIASGNQNKTYGATDPALNYTVTPSLISGDSFTGSLSRDNGENTGTYNVNIGTLTAGNNYAATFIANTFTISPKPITVKVNSGQTKVYGASDPALTYSTTPALYGSDAFTGTLSRVSGENSGNYPINQGSLNAGNNYTITFVPDNFTITPKLITVTANSNQTKVYGASDPALTYAASPSLLGSDVFSGTLARTSGENVNSYAINQGSLNASSNYNISFVSASFTITAKPITVTVQTNQTKVYGSSDPAFNFSVAPNLIGSDAFSGTLTRTFGENANSYAINQGSLSAGSNYNISFVSASFTITPKPITVTVQTNQTKVYGSSDPAFNFSVTPNLIGSDAFTGQLSRGAGENAGSYAISKGTLNAGSNYSITYVPNNFSITPKPIVIIATGSQNKTYGATDPALNYTVTPGLISGDSFTGSLSRDNGENIGTYNVNIGTLNAGNNYSATFISNTFTINAKPITVKVDSGQYKIYGEVDPTVTYTVSPQLINGDVFSGNLKRTVGENVGTYAIQQSSFTAGNNYTITFKSSDFTIKKKALTISADNKSKNYGETNPVYTLTYAGFVNNNDASVLDVLPTITCSATSNSVSGSYTIALSGGTDTNYEYSLVNGTLKINTISGTVTAATIQNIGKTTADISGEVTNTGGEESAARGFVYATSKNPTLENLKLECGFGLGVFSQSLSNLTSNTTYYVRSYVSNSKGIAYGNEVSFTTLSTGVLDIKKAEITIYPNPSDGRFTICFGAAISGKVPYSVFNQSGKKCYSSHAKVSSASNCSELNISTLPRGLYIIKFETTLGTIVEKVVIQ